MASQARGNTSRSLQVSRTGIKPGIPSTTISCGGDKVNTIVADILSTLKSLHYSGDQRNFTFDKYCTAHVDQHNCHAALAKWNVKPLEETMKINYFESGITDPSFAFVKSTMMVDCMKFQEFQAVMHLYVNYKRSQKAEAPTNQARNVSALQGHGGGRQGRGRRGRGGQGGPGGRLSGGVPQKEVNKVTTVEARTIHQKIMTSSPPPRSRSIFSLCGLQKPQGTLESPIIAQPLWQS